MSADKGTANGVGRSLKTAFAPDSPVDPELRRLIREADGQYSPDMMADKRRDQLLRRLERLPWGDPSKEEEHVRSPTRI